MLPKYYTKVGESWKCLCHNQLFETLDKVKTHSFEHRLKNNLLNEYEIHFTGRCGKHSRRCRYCHPEKNLNVLTKEDEIRIAEAKLSINFDVKISALLSLESRYRNKFREEHIGQLERLQKRGQLKKRIKTLLEQRQKKLVYNDGKQTPYIKHGIDIACHLCATCCRGCISKWHGLEKSPSRILTDQELDILTGFVYRYITELILRDGEVKEFMMEKKQGEYFYKPGKYVIEKVGGVWEVTESV